MVRVELEVNGRSHAVEADGSMPLLWVLRDLLGLTGTKYGCGIGACGACTVLLDGEAVRSCTLPVSAAGRASLTTIEGFGDPGADPVLRAWLAEDVAQCGYCQPGMIVRTRALLATDPDPDDAAIDEALRGHVCRCGSYTRIRRAIHRAAADVRAEAGRAVGGGEDRP